MGYENYIFQHSDDIHIDDKNVNFEILKKACEEKLWDVVNGDEDNDDPTSYKLVCKDFSGYHPWHLLDLEKIFQVMKENKMKLYCERNPFFCYKILVIGETLDSNYLLTVKPNFSLTLQISNYSNGTITSYSSMEEYRECNS